MGTLLIEILKLIYFLLPAYFADMAPVFFKKSLLSLDKPLDYGLKLRRHDIFGPHKTVRGVIVGIVVGTIVFYFQKALGIDSIIKYEEYSMLLGFLLSAGAISGDLVKSLIKRRLNISAGSSFYIADQADAVIGALFFASLILDFTWFQISFMIISTVIFKIMINHLAFYLHIRNEKW
jgi:CDP-2,3-bis-(O-geranylgeranyl)-sn-glycerol synthase